MTRRPRPFLSAEVRPRASYVIVRELEQQISLMAANYSSAAGMEGIGQELWLALESMRESGRQWFEAYRAATSADGSAEVPREPAVPVSEAPPWLAGVSVPAAAEVLGLSDRQIRNLIDGGKLSAVRVGRARLIDEVSLAAEVERRRAERRS